MTTNRIFFSAVCFALLVMIFPVYAFSDDAPEKGFKITKDTVLNVGIAINPEFESNITKASEDTVTTDSRVDNGAEKKTEILSDMILHYSPSLRIKLDDDKKTLGFSMLLDYNHYLGIENSKTARLKGGSEYSGKRIIYKK